MTFDSNKSYAVWGCGQYLKNTISKIPSNINIRLFCDKAKEKIGSSITYNGVSYLCVSTDSIINSNIDIIIVAIESAVIFEKIKEETKNWGKRVCHINELLLVNKEQWEAKQIDLYDRCMQSISEPGEMDKIVSFVSVNVPVDFCNLQCEYCYIGQMQGFYKKNTIIYSADFMRRAFSRKRFGGTCFINFCGTGETLLCDGLIEIIEALLDEGHYISIITNALLEKKISRLIENTHADHLFFKCSFHYSQLKEKKLLDLYSKIVNMIKNSQASLSIELVPHDSLIPYIDEIKEFSKKEFDALPHITVARNEAKPNMEILSGLDYSEYYNIWKSFDSKMFEFKMAHLEKQKEYCIAGKGTILVDMGSGGTRPCCGADEYTNIYDCISDPIEIKEVGYWCKAPYCFNNHAYYTLGMVPKINCCSYLEIRDRICGNGSHWVKTKMSCIFSQRICANIKD